MKRQWGILAGLLFCIPTTRGEVAFSQPPSSSGGLIMSSWVEPDGSDSDMYAWDSFTLPADAAINKVTWRGGYAYGLWPKVHDFSITFYASTAGNSQPLCGWPEPEETIYLAAYFVGNNAGESYAGTYGGVAMYDYSYDLPTPFVASADVKYWIKIEGYQSYIPDWGITVGTGGNGSHFHFSTGAHMFYFAGFDTNFTLYAPPASDFDFDGDVDLADFSHVSVCVGAPGQPPAGPECENADLDHDSDVDLLDFAEFQNCFAGANTAPACD